MLNPEVSAKCSPIVSRNLDLQWVKLRLPGRVVFVAHVSGVGRFLKLLDVMLGIAVIN